MLNKVPIICLLVGENIRLKNNFPEIWEIKYYTDLRYMMNIISLKVRCLSGLFGKDINFI